MAAWAQGRGHGAAVVHTVDVPLAAVTQLRDLLHVEQLGERRRFRRHD
jgi:hypothetical protein